MKVIYKEAKTISEFVDAIRIRVDVFIIEQKCPAGWEPDEEDKESRHFIAVADGKVAATARVRQTGQEVIKIERMATKKEYREKGISRGMVEFILRHATKQKAKRIWMESQVQAQKFYEKLGFKTISEPYDLWNLGIPHVKMEFML